MKPRTTISGQALIELLISSGLLVLVLSGTGWIFKSAWERGKCAYLVFENTRALLSDPSPGLSRLRRNGATQAWTESNVDLIGWGPCNHQMEKVGFKKLETMREWR